MSHRLPFRPIFQLSIQLHVIPWQRQISPKASEIAFQMLRSLWKVISMETVCQPDNSEDNTDIKMHRANQRRQMEPWSRGKAGCTQTLWPSALANTTFTPPSTLKELYQAGFNSLNARTCRDLLVKWMIIMGKTKGSPYVKKPSWWPDNIKYQSARMLCGFGMCSRTLMLTLIDTP